MNGRQSRRTDADVSAGCHINDVMNLDVKSDLSCSVSAGCHINDVMNKHTHHKVSLFVSAGCHINDVMNFCPSNTVA